MTELDIIGGTPTITGGTAAAGWQPSYCTVNDLASFMGEPTDADAEMALAIETASRSVDRICNRQFGLDEHVQTRRYTASSDVIDSALTRRRRWMVEIDDVMTTNGLVVETEANGAFTEIGSGNYLLTPVNAVLGGKPWTKLVISPASPITPDGREHGVAVTASFGWTAVPGAIKMATMIQASRLFARRHAPFGIAGNPEVGELRLLASLDVDLIVSVKPYQRIWGAV